MNRREWLKGAAVGAVALAVAPRLRAVPGRDAAVALAGLEHAHGGRLGVAVLDTGNGRRVAHRGDERFLLCSTFKLVLAAVVLARADRGDENLERRIEFDKTALLDWAPVTRHHVGPPGMTIAELCRAAITQSDNTAANLLLREIGGPQAVTAYARSLGDEFTVLDRYEPALNPRDTTTPKAMLADMHQLLLGGRLAPSSRGALIRWLVDCQTGLESLRAGMPKGWRVGDKTGQWDGDGSGANNDVAIVWPPGRKPLLVTAYYMNHTLEPAARKAVLAGVGRIVAAMV